MKTIAIKKKKEFLFYSIVTRSKQKRIKQNKENRRIKAGQLLLLAYQKKYLTHKKY